MKNKVIFCLSFFASFIRGQEEILPFGVEHIFGQQIDRCIHYPKTTEDVCDLVIHAKNNGAQVSVIGSGMCQGIQTIPVHYPHVVLNTKFLNDIAIDLENNTVKVGAGATWEQIQLKLDSLNKSVIVKQASDIFSVGGSIGINCHGWAHKFGSISKTVRSMRIVDSDGMIRILHAPRKNIPYEELTDDEKLFKCMFGTLGYFGVILEVTLDIVDNVMVQEIAHVVDLNHFNSEYERIKDAADISIFRGRFILQNGALDKISMVSYHDILEPLTKKIEKEPEFGRLIERVGINLITRLPPSYSKKLISFFWNREKNSDSRKMTRNEALHPPINAIKTLHTSNSHTQWLQEYFVEKEKLPDFIHFLETQLKENNVVLINATIRPTPQDDISILPYADKDRYAIVLCFSQKKTKAEIEKTRGWIEKVNQYLSENQGVFYQAYMPFATKEQFETCYNVERMRLLKRQFDPQNVFGNAHTAKYFD